MLPTTSSKNSSSSSSSSSNGYNSHASHRRDRPVAIALVIMLMIYMSVTVIAYIRVSSAVDDPQQQSAFSGGSILRRGAAVDTISPFSVIAKSSKSASDMMIANYDVNNPKERFKHNFPFHVVYPSDTESIPHPGLMLIKDASKIPADLPRNVTVPKLYAEIPSVVQAYGGTTSVRNFLGDNGHRLITKEEAMSIGSFTPRITNGKQQAEQLETIYCSVASYRDPECTGTVEDLYARADHPERIRVAIIDQVTTGDNDCHQPAVPCAQDPLQMLCIYAHLIDYYPMDARMGVGPVFARHLAHRHYRGEYFAMQIDSHVRFIQHWDVDIVAQWKSAKNEMAVLTTYLSDITGSIDPETHTSKHPGRPIMCQSDFEGSGQYKHLRHGQQPEGIPGITGQPTLHPFWAAGFSFARGHFVIQIPYDQYLPMVFQGEEISIGLRAFTYGYDFYTPEHGVCFHMYAVKENAERRKKIPLFWENSQMYTGTGMSAMKRLNTLIHMGDFPKDQWPQEEQEKYGLGQIRTTQKFFDTFGIHVKNQTVEQHLCRFVGKPMMREFLPKLRPDGMGIDYDKIDYKYVDQWKDEDKKKTA